MRDKDVLKVNGIEFKMIPCSGTQTFTIRRRDGKLYVTQDGMTACLPDWKSFARLQDSLPRPQPLTVLVSIMKSVGHLPPDWDWEKDFVWHSCEECQTRHEFRTKVEEPYGGSKKCPYFCINGKQTMRYFNGHDDLNDEHKCENWVQKK